MQRYQPPLRGERATFDETSMRAYKIKPGDGLSELRRHDVLAERLGPSDVKVRVGAASLNYRDLMIAKGQYLPSSRYALIPLSDGAGQVVETGTAVTRFKAGDWVIANFWPSWSDGPMTAEAAAGSLGFEIDGLLADEFVAHEGAFAQAPRSLSPAEAATLPCAGVTAWNALFAQADLKPGATVLIQGTGGVSIWALQLAVAAGLRTIVLSSSDEKLARARNLGGTELVNYWAVPDWQVKVLDLTDGRGVDLVVEVGGEGTLPRSIAATKMSGTVVVIGGLSGFGGATVSPGMLVGTGKQLAGISVGSRAMLENLVRFIDTAGIRPVIDRRFGFDEAVGAYEHLEAGRQFGKIVVEVAS